MLSDKDIGNFFVMMSSIFGHKFKSSYGSAVDSKGNITMTAKIWKKTLNGIPHIKDIMADLFSPDSPLMDSKEWCPDLREVVQICKELSNKQQRKLRLSKEYEEYKRIDNKVAIEVDEKIVKKNRVEVLKTINKLGNKIKLK